MKTLTCKELARLAGGKIISGNESVVINEVVIDSRKAKAGSIFVALKGENHDAHSFLESACEAGACAVMISNEESAKNLIEKLEKSEGAKNVTVIKVEDTLEGLTELSRKYLETFDIKKVAVTGSTGKTSTKDMLHCILSEKYVTAKTKGNYNNEIGMPLTILALEEGTEAVVLEMGMSSFGEIHHLVDVARPDLAIITNVGIAHMENLGSREGILKAKLEVTDFFDENNLLIIYDDGDVLSRESAGGRYRIETIGKDGNSEFIISSVDDRGAEGVSYTLEHNCKAYKVNLSVAGVHNAINASLAIAAGLELGVSIEEAVAGLGKLKLTDKRLSLKGKNGIKVIDDTYNASPDSMKAGISVLTATSGIRKVAVLGDMYELGENSFEYHKQVGKFAALKKVDLVIAIGKEAKGIYEGAAELLPPECVAHFDTKEEFIERINEYITKGDVVIVKGSRGMSMEKIVEKILE